MRGARNAKKFSDASSRGAGVRDGLRSRFATTIDAFIDIVPSFTPTSGPLGTTFTFTGVVSIDISVSPTPFPAALPLFATGLGALGLFGWRTKRKKAAATTA